MRFVGAETTLADALVALVGTPALALATLLAIVACFGLWLRDRREARKSAAKQARKERRDGLRPPPYTGAALALLLLGSPVGAADKPERLSAPDALAWAAVPMAFDLWTTDHAFAAHPTRARETNLLGATAEKRNAIALAGTAGAAVLFYRVENGGSHWSRKVPRWLWVAAHVGAGIHNLRTAGRK